MVKEGEVPFALLSQTRSHHGFNASARNGKLYIDINSYPFLLHYANSWYIVVEPIARHILILLLNMMMHGKTILEDEVACYKKDEPSKLDASRNFQDAASVPALASGHGEHPSFVNQQVQLTQVCQKSCSCGTLDSNGCQAY